MGVKGRLAVSTRRDEAWHGALRRPSCLSLCLSLGYREGVSENYAY